MEASPTPPIPKSPTPVMDVVPPHPETPTAPEPMATAPPPDADSQPAPPVTVPADQKTPPKSKPPQPPKPPKTRNGVTAAIFATVIIVLGLALLAVYAYTAQK